MFYDICPTVLLVEEVGTFRDVAGNVIRSAHPSLIIVEARTCKLGQTLVSRFNYLQLKDVKYYTTALL